MEGKAVALIRMSYKDEEEKKLKVEVHVNGIDLHRFLGVLEEIKYDVLDRMKKNKVATVCQEKN
jgi:hypothetical protein